MRREELIADRKLTAVSGRLAFVAHLPALFAGIEVLINPPNRFVFGPHALQIVSIEDREQFVEGRFLWPKHRGWIPPIEQDLHFGGEFIEDALEIKPIAGAIGSFHRRGKTAKLGKAARTIAAADAFLNKLPRFKHLEGREAI